MAAKFLKNVMHAAAITVAALSLHACSDSGHPDGPETAATAILHLRVNLANSRQGSRAADGYEADRLPADDGEKMQTLRIIILDGRGNAEHNSLWDLRAAPDVTATGQAFPVRANDTKTILLLANEHSPGMEAMRAYLAGINAAAGQHVDMRELHALQLDAPVKPPLPMSAVHSYHIGSGTEYSASFLIHRAATKYSFRITNNDPAHPHRIDYVAISNIASTQYLFPDADFTDDTQMQWSAYRAPAGAGSEERTFTVNADVASGSRLDVPAIYLPEGVPGDDVYRAGLSVDGSFLGWCELENAEPGTTGDALPMTDLPRNTHVIVNVTLNHNDYKIHYTVCPWQTHDIDIPSFD